MTLTEAIYRELLNEAPDYEKLRELANQAVERGISDSVGDRGPLQLETGNVNIHDGKCHLVQMSDIMGKSVYSPIKNRYYNIARDEYNNEISRIHQNYAKAMSTHFPNGATSYHKFSRMMLNSRYTFTDGDSYIMMMDLGRFSRNKSFTPHTGYWVVTHFAPSSNIAGAKLLKELFHYDNIIMAVTEHMWPQLVKMGLVYKEFSAMVNFRHVPAEKMFFSSDKELMKSNFMDELCDAMNGDDEEKKLFAMNRFQTTQNLYDKIHNPNIANKVGDVVHHLISKMFEGKIYF